MKFSFSILSFVFFIFFGLISVAQESEIPKPLKIYKSANYEVKSFDYEGLETYMSIENDTTYVYNFWATWCAPCIAELPSFIKLQETYKDKPFKLVLVSLDFSKSVEKSLLPFLEKKKMNVEVILLNDPDANSWIEKIDKDWSGAIPATLIVNKNERKFYEQSFEYEELEKEVKSFVN
ncbi:TlpA disulfide reductase family protein [uncultured Flavobacterium sp.]|uniref:TlpA disulfide reductase family protein n=1 Tax=uncultured Flavobacterium sp. TaxID=165435 RepID=UPI0030EECC09